MNLTLSPNTTIRPATVDATATGLGGGSRYNVRLDGSVIATARATRAGTLSVGVAVSASSRIGAHTVDLRDSANKSTLAAATLTVTDAVPPPVIVPGAFMSYPLSGALNYVNQSDVVVSNLSFRSVGNRPALRFEGCHNVTVRDCDFDGLDWDAINVLNCTGTLTITFNRCGRLNLNPAMGRGGHPDFLQLDKCAMTGWIGNNHLRVGPYTEDIISIYMSGGPNATNPLVIEDNDIQGASEAAHSGSGSGMMLADNGGGHIVVRRNYLYNPGQVGIGISNGTDVHVIDNVIYGAQRGNSNVGIYTPYIAGVPNPGGHEVARNRIWWKNAAGTPNPVWDGGASGVIAGWSTNVLQDPTIVPREVVL